MNRTKLRSFDHFQIFTKIAYQDLSTNLENWLNLKFILFDCKTAKGQSKWSNSITNMIYTCFLDKWDRIRKFYWFSNLDQNRIPGPLQKSWKFTNFEVYRLRLWNHEKSIKLIIFDCKHDLHVFSWWVEQN